MTYTDRPHLYDVVYSFKDYAAECSRIEELIRVRQPQARTLLDVACGTGKHLELLRNRFAVEGLDLDPGLLACARERLPDIPLHLGDMRSFALGRQFDAVTCLFSSIGFVLDLDGLAAAVRSLAKHVAGGGVLLIEPWITPEDWLPDLPHVLAVSDPRVAVARVTVSGQRGRISTTRMEYLVGTPGGVEHFREDQELGLFTNDEMREALESAELSVEYDDDGLIGRGLWIATR